MSGAGPVVKKEKKPKEANRMRSVRVEKVVLNIGCGGKLPIDKAKKLLEDVTGAKVVLTIARKRTTFGTTPIGKPIGVKVTIRPRKGAKELIKRLLTARENIIPPSSFDESGNVNFGIREYIDIPGLEYDPKMGIVGMNVVITLERPGYRSKRKSVRSKVGPAHLLNPQAAQEFMKSEFGIKIEEVTLD